ncbi:hypothetical protein GWG65_06840 [Bradyrhizobium sp. CSA207]|nr:hypothetical protein [Bradyrhizobium sp. CSA207]MDE5441178.1 hypothetical protein [Bradyrhizobium sp. CSA207]
MQQAAHGTQQVSSIITEEGHGDREQEACRDDRRHGTGDDLGLLSDGG